MSSWRFDPSAESEARILLLIDAFSGGERGHVQGRTKLAKLDFLLRYPRYLRRALARRNIEGLTSEEDPSTIEQRMVRFRYGPWDPAYFAILGSLVGRGLVEVVHMPKYIGFRTTDLGKQLAREIGGTEVWADVAQRSKLLRRAFGTQSGQFMKHFVYENFPEVTQATWGESL